MKRVIAAVVAILLLCSLCGCDDPKTPQGEPMEDTTQAVIDLVSMLPVGTMGVSLKAIESAVSLMEWCEATSLTAEQVAAQLSSYCMELDNTAYMMFYEQVHLVTSQAAEWQDKTQLESDLRMVGLNPKDYTWDAHAFEILEAVTMGCEVIYD